MKGIINGIKQGIIKAVIIFMYILAGVFTALIAMRMWENKPLL